MIFVEVLKAPGMGINSHLNWRTKQRQHKSSLVPNPGKIWEIGKSWEQRVETKKQDNAASSKSCGGIDFIKADFRGIFQGCNFFTWVCSSSTRHTSKVVLGQWLWVLRATKGTYCQNLSCDYSSPPPMAFISLYSKRRGKIASHGSALIHV